MTLVPFVSFKGIHFGETLDEVITVLDTKFSRSKNRLGWTEISIPDEVYRFDNSDELVEMTMNLASIELDNMAVGFDELRSYVIKNDVIHFYRVGFLVSPKYGLAFDPECANWITFFRQSELESWRNIKQ